VLDAGTLLAAPYGATLLGDLGADVVKLEPPRGEDSRHLGPERGGERTAFLSLNRNKRSLALDLRGPDARSAFAKLAATLDVVVTNVREPALSELGLGYEQLRVHRPDVIWIGVSAFGPDGPYGQRPGIDFLVQGYAGLLALTGEPDAPPVRVTVPLVDVMTSLLVANAAQAGLLARARTGQGQRIDVSLLDALVHAQCSALVSWLVAGEAPARTGNRSRYFAPSGIYPTRDGSSIVLTCPSDKFFRNACRALGVAWDADPRFASVEARLAHEEELDALLAARCRELPRDALIERLAAADALGAPVLSIPEVAADPQVRHNGMLVEAAHEKLGPIELTGVPIRLHGTPGGVRRAPPLLGRHTRELLAEAGCTPAEIARALAAAPEPAPRRQPSDS
jgi:crotonobetainyl-CoA:carnitine CoA-transferase CaiB-like acyl-CoA transferase